MRNIEENIVFASTRKMLGLGKKFDEKLVELQVKATPPTPHRGWSRAQLLRSYAALMAIASLGFAHAL